MVDHYRVRQLVGRGGMGAVYLARDTRLGRKVALKVIHRVGARAVEDFLEEARVTARFNHPHIVAVYGAGEIDGRPYLALEYLEGRTLRDQLREARLPVGRAVRVAEGVAQALAEAHAAGVVHGDLKPENVFLPRDGYVRVLDFGLARVHDPAEGPRAGTPLYMAPEQWEGAGSAASDVWAFGLCLFEMLAGGHPFADRHDPNYARLRARYRDGDVELPSLPEPETAPPSVAALLRACLALDPEARPSARRIAQELDGILHGARADAEEPPFRGLLPFGAEHAREFFGRDAEVALFVERLRTEPILPVVGPSGAGKSSFVLAGVIPRLREQAYWRVLQLRPGRDPFGALASRLAHRETITDVREASSTVDFAGMEDLDEDDRDPPTDPAARTAELLETRLRAAPTTLHLVLDEIAAEQRCNVLLLVDQLEELYTLVPDEALRRAFMTALCTAADDPADPIRVVFTVRDDFLGRLAEAPAAADALARVALIRPLGRDALADTLVRPVRDRGFSFDDPALVAEMVDEVADSPAALPLLQFAARQLWERRDVAQRVLRRWDYQAIGGVAGALARHGDDVLAGLGHAQQQVARQLLLRLLTPDGTRRTVPWSEALDGLGDEAEPTLERLVQSRLLAVREGEGRREVELAHESLVRAWSRLRRWHAESGEEVRVLAEIEEAARLWDRRGRRPEELWGGDTLQDAQRAARAADLALSQVARGFLDAATAQRLRAARLRQRVRAAILLISAAVTLASVVVALAFARQRREAMVHAAQAEEARAEALAAGGYAALASGDVLGAQAQLRSSLSLRDSAAARALWGRLRDRLVIWSLETPYWPHGHAISSDGHRLAVAGSDGILRVFDLRTGAVRAFRADDGPLARPAFSPSGDRVAAASFTGNVRVWRSPDEPPVVLSGVPADLHPYHLDFLGDDALQLYAYRPGSFETVMVRWRLDGGEPTIVDGTRGHGRMALSPDRRRVVSGNPRGGEVTLFDVAGGAPPRALGELSADDRLGAFAFRGTRVAAVGRSVVVWDLATDEPPVRFDGIPTVVRAAGWLDDDTLVGVGGDGTIRLWSASTGEIRDEAALPADGDPEITGGEVTALGQLYLNREDGLTLLDLRRLAPEVERRGHRGAIEALAASPDGATVASGAQDGEVRLWDAATGVERAVLADAHGAVTDLAFSPDGALLAAAAGGNAALVWSVADGQLLRRLPHDADVKSVVFTADGQGLVSADYGGFVRQWDLAGLRDPETRARAAVAVVAERRLATNPLGLDRLADGRLVASDYYGKLHVFRVAAGPVTTIDAHPTQVHTVIAAGGRVVSAGFDGVARVWDAGDGALVRELPVHGTSGLALAPDGRVLHGTGQGAALWDLATGEVEPVPGPPGGVFLDATTYVSGDGSGAVRPIDLATGRSRWRTVLADEAALRTTSGWIGDAPAGRWADAVAGAWRADANGDTLCVLTGGRLERWDRAADRLVGTEASDARDVVALEGACAAGDGLQAQPGGRATRLGDDEVVVIEPDGTRGAPEALPTGVSAVRLDGERAWLGFVDGGLAWGSGGELTHLVTRRAPPASPVVAVAPGPGRTVFSAHRDGRVVLWDLRSGAALVERKLHGAPVHLVPVPHGLLIATDAGDHETVDLSELEAEWCDVLGEVEALVPTVWDGERIVVAPPRGCGSEP